MRTRNIALGALALAALIGVGIYVGEPYISGPPAGQAAPRLEPARAEAGPRAVPVVAVEVQREDVPVEITAVGTVQASETVALRSRIDAEIVNVHFREGQEVKQGDVLFTLDSRAIEAQLRQAMATLERDRATLENARRDLARKTELSQQGYATAASLDQSRAAFGAASGTVKASEAAIQNLRVQLSYAAIRAPITGRTGSVTQTKGNMVKASDPQPLVVINRIQPVKASFAVPQANFDDVSRAIARGRVEVMAGIQGENSAQQPGTVTFVDNQIDTATGTFQVKASFPNEAGGLWPGMMVDLVIRLGVERGVPTVPLTAVVTGQEGPFVFVVKPDQTAELRQIAVARESGDRTIVAKGLTAGERVVTEGQLRLAHGARVTVRNAPAPQVAADPTRPAQRPGH